MSILQKQKNKQIKDLVQEEPMQIDAGKEEEDFLLSLQRALFNMKIVNS